MLTACTIVARNYLPFARVLADSFFRHHPDGSLTVLIVDDEARDFAPDDPRIDWRRLSDLGLDPREIHRLAGIYDVTELATAVKPRLLQTLLDDGRDHVLYLDPDIRIFASLEPLAFHARERGIVLTPHTMQPYPRDERQVDGFFVLAAGVYNLGFVGVGQAARPFLEWWWQVTRREALVDVARMMFTDQRWVDFVPCLFDPVIVKDPGYNVAYWNLHGRDLTREGDHGAYRVDGVPLRFFHFSGFDIKKPWLLSKHQGERPRVLLSERPVVAAICQEYADSLRAAGIDVDGRLPYGWNQLASGLPFSTRIRRLYWNSLMAAERTGAEEPPDPFDAAASQRFVDWLNSPSDGGPRRVSRYLYSIYLDRIDLQVHFPDIYGADADRFAAWVWDGGAEQVDIPFELLPNQTPNQEPHAVVSLAPGLNIAGYFRAELGIGEAARLLTRAVEAAGLSYSTVTYDATLSRQSHAFAERAIGPMHDVNLICVNADSTPRFARDAGPSFLRGRHNIGYWFWELEQFPPTMVPAFDVVDEVWTATDFVAGAVRSAGARPVFTMPLPVMPLTYPAAITRQRVGLPPGFSFLLMFDFLSVMERKNPLGLIQAFSEAFTPGEGPVLVLKSINGHLRLSDLERLRAEAARRPDIRIIDGYFSDEEKRAIVGLSDCYVSLHRSEGFGLTMAEAMTIGKPVIATGYSGNLHFMTQENSFLVDYSRGTVPAGCDPYREGAVWADPNLAQAAAFMREVYERPEAAAVRGSRGRTDLLERHGVATSAAAIARRVERIQSARRSRIVGTGLDRGALERAPTSAEALEARLPHLEQMVGPRVSTAGRPVPWLRELAQRVLFRLTRPYWFQQRRLNSELIGTLREVAADLHRDERARVAVVDQLQKLTLQFRVATRRTEPPKPGA